MLVKHVVAMVAPHVGAWIEITRSNLSDLQRHVAPHVGAWIEIDVVKTKRSIGTRRTSRRCVD